MVTAHASVETAVEAMRHGAYDYIKKPFEPGEMELIVGRAAEHRRLLRENRNLRVACESRFAAPNIIGQSAVMARVFDLVAKVAPLDVTVLVEGESGTGKDLIARAIHARSRRAAGAYVSLNCAAIPDNLLESELFGYEKGAFSGAAGARPGFFAAADGARSSSTRSATWARRCSRSCSACCRTAPTTPWAAARSSTPTCA